MAQTITTIVIVICGFVYKFPISDDVMLSKCIFSSCTVSDNDFLFIILMFFDITKELKISRYKVDGTEITAKKYISNKLVENHFKESHA